MLRVAMLVIAFILSSSAVAQWALPVLQTRTLADAEFSIPADLPERTSLLIIGFTNASREQTSAWSRLLAQDDGLSNRVAVYQVAVVEDVPAMMRRFVVRGIRGGVPEPLHDSFLVVSEQSEDWKALAAYSEPDAAYLVLLDRQGNVGWQGTGAPDDASVQAFLKKVAELEGD